MLTYSQLSYFDDVLVNCLIDKVYYWAEIRKVREYKPIRGVPVETVLDILTTDIIGKDSNPQRAVKRFVELPSVTTFLGRFQDRAVRQEFEKHVKRYMQIYSMDCGFDIEVTDRYKSRSQALEACVISRRMFKEGEELKHLSGILVELTAEEEDELNMSKDKDFSIINSSRRGANCLMLGPARFVNHDCQANARFVSNGMNMNIYATRAIAVGEEITVQYSENYFGKKNRECLCFTCEKLERNGFSKVPPPQSEDDSEEESIFSRASTAGTETTACTESCTPPSPSVEPGEQFNGKSKPQVHYVQPAVSVHDMLEGIGDEECLARLEVINSVGLRPLLFGIKPPTVMATSNVVNKQDANKLKQDMHPESEPKRTLRARTSRPDTIAEAESFETLLRRYFSLPFTTDPTDILKCDNCRVPFVKVQAIALKTRKLVNRLCPRCNRHAILYNAAWPSVVRLEHKIELYKSEYDLTASSSDSNSDSELRKRSYNKSKRRLAPAVSNTVIRSSPRKLSTWLKQRLKQESQPPPRTKRSTVDSKSDSTKSEDPPKRKRGRPRKDSTSSITPSPKRVKTKPYIKPERTSTRILERRISRELVSGPRRRRPSLKLREEQ